MQLWHFLPLAVWAIVATNAQACATDDDCSLNGLCTDSTSTNTSLACQCDPGWFGTDCGRLDLAPATRYTGFNNTNYTSPDHYNNRGNSSWGGQIMQDQDDPKLFHLLYDQFAHGCGLSGWRPTSFIARAESTSGPQGPYVWRQNVTGSFRHNAYVYWSPADDKYLLWSIGVDVPDPKQCGGINKYVKTVIRCHRRILCADTIQSTVAKQHLRLLSPHNSRPVVSFQDPCQRDESRSCTTLVSWQPNKRDSPRCRRPQDLHCPFLQRTLHSSLHCALELLRLLINVGRRPIRMARQAWKLACARTLDDRHH